MIFLFYREEEDRSLLVYHTHRDVLFAEIFKSTILFPLHAEKSCNRDIVYSPDTSIASHARSKPMLIGETGYSCVLVHVDRDESRDVFFTPISEEAVEYRMLDLLWKEFLSGSYSSMLGVEKRIALTLRKIAEGSNKPSFAKSPLDLQAYPDIKDHEEEFFDKQLDTILYTLNDIYESVCESPILSNCGKKPPNIFFFWRYYGSRNNTNRLCHDNEDGVNIKPYPYSLRLLLPKKQMDHCRSVLESIHLNGRIPKNSQQSISSDEWGFNPPFFDYSTEVSDCCEIKSDFPDEELRDKFWEFMKKESAIDEVIRVLKSPFGSKAVGLVDPPLSSGFSHFRRDIFGVGGRDRLSKSEYDKGFSSDDVKRVVFLHYLLSSAAPEAKDLNPEEGLGSFIIPLRVASKAYLALGHAAIVQKKGAPASIDRWLQNYHFFTDVARHVLRRFRYKSKVAYREQLSDRFKLHFMDMMDNVALKKKKSFSISNAIYDINRDYSKLCRVWPYPMVKLEYITIGEAGKGSGRKSPADKASSGVSFWRGRYHIFINIYDNPYYKDEDVVGQKSTDILSIKDIENDLQSTIHSVEANGFLRYVNMQDKKHAKA